MRFKILIPGNEKELLEFLLWLTPEALETWHPYGKKFSLKKVEEILKDFSSLKIGGFEEIKDISLSLENPPVRTRIVVFGALYHFTLDSCRLSIVAGVTGKGYGTKLMKVLINFAKASGVKRIYLSAQVNNYPALALYKKFGFKIVKKYTDRPRHKYEMVKEL